MDLSPEEEYFPGRLLHQAALWDNAELLEDLLKSDTGPALVNSIDQHGRTALHAAAVSERSRCLGILLKNGADPNVACNLDSGGKTALHTCAERGHADNIATLLSGGAIWSLPDASRSTALDLAERAGHRHAAGKLRDARGTDTFSY